jgi:hypothetical protein
MRVGGVDKDLARVRVWKGDAREVGLGLAGETLLADAAGARRTRADPRSRCAQWSRRRSAPVSRLGRLRLTAGEQTLAEYPLVARVVGAGGWLRAAHDRHGTAMVALR